MTTNQQDRWIYHITHIRNVPGILARGYLLCDSAAASEGLIAANIGMPSIKTRRRTTPVPCGPGGTPADYVPFYFGPRSPMLFSISCGNVPTYTDGQDPVVYLATTVGTVRAAGLRAVFTEGNAGAGFVRFHDDGPHLESAIDWPLMRERFWNDTPEDPGRANRRQAEYLVHHAVPVQLIRGVATRTERRGAELGVTLTNAGLAIPIRVRPDWYY